MTSLQNLQAEAREKFNTFIKEYCGVWYPHLIDTDDNDGEFFRDYLDELAEKAYTAALQEALGKVFEVTLASNDQMKIVRAIRSLIPKKDI